MPRKCRCGRIVKEEHHNCPICGAPLDGVPHQGARVLRMKSKQVRRDELLGRIGFDPYGNPLPPKPKE